MLYLIVNPVAGKGRALKSLPTIKAFLNTHQLNYQLLQTRGRGHAAQLTRGLPDDAVVVVVGGDGTLHEVATACIATKRTLGVIPMGSGDDFAYALGLDRYDVMMALSTIKAGHVVQVDTGQVNDSVFINAFGVGFDAEVAHAVQHSPKLLKGKAAYFYAVFKALRTLKNTHVHIHVDERQVFSGKALLVAIQNGPRTGGSFLFAPDASLVSSQLELVVAKDFTKTDVVTILPKVMRGQHQHQEKITFATGKDIVLTWQHHQHAHTDGELLPQTKQFHVRINPASLRVLAPL